MGRNKKSKKSKVKKDETWTEEEYEEYLMGLYGMDFIAGYTAGGMPYGSFIDEDDECNEEVDVMVRDIPIKKKEDLSVRGIPYNEDDDLPF